ncbi:helix-turn-helix domain-containing protein [Thalassotalea sp. G20_0]|uniref:helix-turn-helix transcriptional regulator n=1 Tax=Thalassotalea sp. G20_0 TaxID=2821093 RepID=UPI001ADA0F08|nr:helix-turn-helix domain-containing protein [Thalassotalea sp. G20_0]MBO9493813.1 helix-turn-helix domain-containing protein [Thalassotalea sp. G20_0]
MEKVVLRVEPVTRYLTTAELADRFRCSNRTIYRWMKREKNPFPKPRLQHCGSSNRWAENDVLAWENKFAPTGQ